MSDDGDNPSTFRLSDADWSEIELECGVIFSASSRAKIASLTETYSFFEACAANAAPLEMAESRLDNFSAGAQTFWKACSELNGSSGEAMYVKYLLRKNFYDGRLPASVDPLGFMRGLMTSLVSACDLAKQQMLPASHGQWDEWVRALRHVFQEQGLKISNRKDGFESPFAALVRQLQERLAAAYQVRLLVALLPMHWWLAATATTQKNSDDDAGGENFDQDPLTKEREAAALAQAIHRAWKGP